MSMNSDSQMDRELRSLATLRPVRSVWPELEKELERRERRRRRRHVLRYLLPGAAASVLVAVLVLVNRVEEANRALEIQKTVENAVRDARPKASFSNLKVDGDRKLETLLVSAKQRRAQAVFAGAGTAASLQPPAPERRNPEGVNEF